jgi:hypothetical protein
MPENQDLPRRTALAQPEFDAHMVPDPRLPEDANLGPATTPLPSDDTAKAINGSLVTAR